MATGVSAGESSTAAARTPQPALPWKGRAILHWSDTEPRGCAAVESDGDRIRAGEPALSTTSATLIYADLNIPEVAAIRERNADGNVPVIVQDQDVAVPTIQLVELSSVQFIADNLNKVFCIPQCIVTNVSSEWFYFGCNVCVTKLHKDGDHFFCHKCNRTPTDNVRRFRITIKVQDSSGDGTFVILDHVGYDYFLKTAEQLYSESSDNDQGLPDCLQQLEGLRLTFHIKINEYNYSKESKNFTIVAIKKEEDKATESPSAKMIQ